MCVTNDQRFAQKVWCSHQGTQEKMQNVHIQLFVPIFHKKRKVIQSFKKVVYIIQPKYVLFLSVIVTKCLKTRAWTVIYLIIYLKCRSHEYLVPLAMLNKQLSSPTVLYVPLI